MGIYDSKIALAKRLITKFGQPVELTRITLGEDAPDKPWRPSPNTEESQTVSAVFLNYDIRQIDGDLIREGDQMVLMSSVDTSVPPSVGDYIKRPVEGLPPENWTIQFVRPLAPNGEFIMYELGVRR